MRDGWIVVTTKPLRESKAAAAIKSRVGADVFLPECHALSGRTQPLFPRYLFARALECWYRLLSCPGVQDVVRYGERPSTVPDREIRALMARRGPDGLFTVRPFPVGARVRLTRGVMGGLAGTVDQHLSHDRVRVLLMLLGRAVSTDVHERDISTA